MNLVLDDAEEINVKKNTRKSLGKEMLHSFIVIVCSQAVVNTP